MTDDRKHPQETDIDRAAEQRRREIDGSENDPRPAESDVFNPVEGVAPHGTTVPDKQRR